MGMNNSPDREQRIAQLLAFHKENPIDAFVNHALGLEWAKAGDSAKAVHYFETVITHNPDYIGTYYHWGKALEAINPLEAADVYERGKVAAKRAGDQHAHSELVGAAEALAESMRDV